MRYLISVAAGLLLACASLEVVFRLLPVSSGIRMTDTVPGMPYASYRPQQPYIYSYGWALNNMQRGVTNRQGFTNSKDLQDGANALVLGDSFIESFMNRYEDTVQGRLDAAVGEVYAAAASGNTLADALVLSRHFLPLTHAKHIIVFVEPGDLRAIEQPAGRGHNHFTFDGATVGLHQVPYVEPAARRLVVKSALARYVYYQLKLPELTKGGTTKAWDKPDSAALARHREYRDRALAFLMTELDKLRREYGTEFVFLVDGDRNAIYSHGKAEPNWLGDDREQLFAEVRKHGFGLVDMQPLFAEHWQRYHERMDFLPMDGHWNPVAHKLAADKVLEVMEEERGKKPAEAR
ncbi:hypothetical protein IP92_00765 [Pseudoduganella flava]|uniref:AlgX/AlgJ SGNH hydrolase-like domain-containing protein n=1 Tax=Pseudoduganella flava TaxID=871742 RepID=A0A562Q4U5_9BURK|nr:hypothetical protein [Pseudoduganella flava]QGZ41774.1 hypothetical protein GO485_23755 [Pseudoduganella flava]TWI51777.1 hypothetical protein IP92_00765 [Pseudoduganella flava]